MYAFKPNCIPLISITIINTIKLVPMTDITNCPFTGLDDCEFDYGIFCRWVNDPTNSYNFDWLRRSGTTPSKSTGPSADHTSSSGDRFQTSEEKNAFLNTLNFCMFYFLRNLFILIVQNTLLLLL